MHPYFHINSKHTHPQYLDISFIKQVVLANWDDFRTANLIEIIQYPELMMQQTQDLLDI